DAGTIAIQRNQSGKDTTFSAKAGGTTRMPLVVLLDKLSARGAEVFAAALHDNGKATLVGDKSAGQAAVSEMQNLADGGAVFISTAYWLTPKAQLIEKGGITPDVELPRPDPASDPQLAKAVDILEAQAQ